MKRWLLLLAFPVLIYSMFLCPSVYAASSVTFESYQFSSPKIYQGQSELYVDLKIGNDGNSSLIVHGASVNFDWQNASDLFVVGSRTSGEPYDLGKELGSGENYVLRIRFSVSLSVPEGAHQFFFKVFYDNALEVQWNPRAQDPYAELIIHSAYEASYLERVASVDADVAQAEQAGFISPEATSLLQQAKDILSNAHSFADEGNWQSAESYLRTSSTRLSQAYAAEERFKLLLVIGGVVGVGAIIGSVLYLRQRKKRSQKIIPQKATEPT